MTSYVYPKTIRNSGGPPPTPITREQAKAAVALALVDVMRGKPVKIGDAVRKTIHKTIGSGMNVSAVRAMVRELATEWAQGAGPDVPEYVPPPPPEKPVVVIEPEPEPEPEPIVEP